MHARFSPDSRRFVYFADVKEKGVAILEDDVAGPIVKAAGEPIFSADSRHVAYGAQSLTEEFFVVLDGVAGKEWKAAGCGDPVFSPDGAGIAWTLWRQEGGLLRKTTICSLLVNDELILDQPGDSLSRWPSFSPDGARVAWAIRRGKSFVALVNAESGPTLAGGGEPVFTSSGRLAYVGNLTSGEWTVFVDHQPGPLAQNLLVLQFGSDQGSDEGFRVSPDGDHIAWAGLFDNQVRPVIDDRVGPAHEQLVSRSFGADGVATWWMQHGEVVYRVRAHSGEAAG
jgi:hypothetical protein